MWVREGHTERIGPDSLVSDCGTWPRPPIAPPRPLVAPRNASISVGLAGCAELRARAGESASRSSLSTPSGPRARAPRAAARQPGRRDRAWADNDGALRDGRAPALPLPPGEPRAAWRSRAATARRVKRPGMRPGAAAYRRPTPRSSPARPGGPKRARPPEQMQRPEIDPAPPAHLRARPPGEEGLPSYKFFNTFTCFPPSITRFGAHVEPRT
jgi:hypothetical protein